MHKNTISIYTIVFQTIERLRVLDVLQTEKKTAFAIVLFFIQDIPGEGHYSEK